MRGPLEHFVDCGEREIDEDKKSLRPDFASFFIGNAPCAKMNPVTLFTLCKTFNVMRTFVEAAMKL